MVSELIQLCQCLGVIDSKIRLIGLDSFRIWTGRRFVFAKCCFWRIGLWLVIKQGVVMCSEWSNWHLQVSSACVQNEVTGTYKFHRHEIWFIRTFHASLPYELRPCKSLNWFKFQGSEKPEETLSFCVWPLWTLWMGLSIAWFPRCEHCAKFPLIHPCGEWQREGNNTIAATRTRAIDLKCNEDTWAHGSLAQDQVGHELIYDSILSGIIVFVI